MLAIKLTVVYPRLGRTRRFYAGLKLNINPIKSVTGFLTKSTKIEPLEEFREWRPNHEHTLEAARFKTLTLGGIPRRMVW